MLVVFTVSVARSLFNGNEGKQALDYVVREGYGTREFLVGGNWISKPTGQVRGSRYNISGQLSTVQDVASVWRYIKKRSVQSPFLADRILEQLLRTRFQGEKLVLFSPWGPRYNRSTPIIEESDPETKTLEEVREVLQAFRDFGYDINFMLMPADAYGTEVNNLSPKFVDEYFKRVEDLAVRKLDSEVDVDVKRWSLIRQGNIDRYNGLRDEIDENFSDWIKEGEFRDAIRVASVFNPGKARESARRYCIERLVEGILIDEVYDPIKLSVVKKEKDKLDGPLKRIYIVGNRAPWLGG